MKTYRVLFFSTAKTRLSPNVWLYKASQAKQIFKLLDLLNIHRLDNNSLLITNKCSQIEQVKATSSE